ncbi:hypothetical protein NDU88_002220 [Pleurodeles waltl]|uniref:Uncharacterized protein n=1 Tax=Pleurodeles waltl TaxID=8319 RepID=A0AAV7PB07_PLEWA|nr:hypothetical protein NDU88_002220 [Pleurodeles waltl]
MRETCLLFALRSKGIVEQPRDLHPHPETHVLFPRSETSVVRLHQRHSVQVHTRKQLCVCSTQRHPAISGICCASHKTRPVVLRQARGTRLLGSLTTIVYTH